MSKTTTMSKATMTKGTMAQTTFPATKEIWVDE